MTNNNRNGSWRTTPLPGNWRGIRARVLRRDGYCCTIDGCDQTDRLEVDHIGPADDHSLANLRTLCHEHHMEKTQQQARAAGGGWGGYWGKINKSRQKFRHNTERHPGYLR